MRAFFAVFIEKGTDKLQIFYFVNLNHLKEIPFSRVCSRIHFFYCLDIQLIDEN
jgi:hypothetical protein